MVYCLIWLHLYPILRQHESYFGTTFVILDHGLQVRAILGPVPYLQTSAPLMRPKWPSGKVPALGLESPNSKPDSIEDPSCIVYWICFTLSHTYEVKRPPPSAVRKLDKGVPAQVSSSSSDRCSKLQSPSQNSPRVASKRDVNLSKLN
ncbi:hypothetical protein AVEN_165972-1 [Araneus ventricosus]|uniref:Uncharacterized protein n=1 Tax=Araneus ventricosus TaxID=182803 RepID=A0A4Y2IFC7_ARAVE|nr:hypothetical protein AVEN_165972-1 [Araneus ventricosus]